jgi:V8-like Glu-specific endopeptidase
MNTHDTDTGAGMASLVSFDEKDMVSGASMGEWQYPQHGVTATWRLEHHEKRGSPAERVYAYRVLVTYMESFVLDVRLDGIEAKTKSFNVRDPRQLHAPVYANVQVARYHEPGNRAKLELLIELIDEPGRPGKIQSLAVCDVPDGPLQPVPGYDPQRVDPDDDAQAPYCCVGQLKMVFKNKKTGQKKSYIGTATVIEAPHKRTGYYLLTCAHNLYDPEYGKAFSVSFIPGLNDQDPPPMELEAEAWHYPPGYETVAISRNADLGQLPEEALQSNSELDYGLVKLKKRMKVSTPVPQVVVPMDEQLQFDAPVALCGLYGWNVGVQAEMYEGAGPLRHFSDTLLYYAVGTKPGSSGSAVFLDSLEAMQIIGVHDFGGGAGNDYNIGHRITGETVGQLNTWMDSGS